MAEIYSFGRNVERGDYWYTNVEGLRVDCRETDFHRMKVDWVFCREKSVKEIGKSMIYSFDKPREISLGDLRGGKREGSGMKPKYGEETIPVSIRVPISRVREYRDYAAEKLKEWELEAKK